MRARDVDRSGIIHSSDFKSAIREYGLDMGNKLVQNILVHCNIDIQGNINYLTLSKALDDERTILLSSGDTSPKHASSQGTVEKPVRADVMFNLKVYKRFYSSHYSCRLFLIRVLFLLLWMTQIQSESNMKNLQANRATIQSMYQKFINDEVVEADFVGNVCP